MTRRTLTIAAVVVALLTAGTAAAAVTTTPSVTGLTSFGSYDTPDDTVTHAPTGNPTWIVTTSDTGGVQSWANESGGRAVLSTSGDRVVLAASGHAIGTTIVQSVFGAGLARQDYVERVTPNRDLSLAEPVSLAAIPTSQNYSYPDGYRAGVLGIGGAEYPTSGIAHRDNTNDTTVADARGVIGADDVTETGDGLTVAVVDSGLNTANGTLGMESRVQNASTDYVSGGDTVADNGVDALEDPNGHGTWVTSAIAADPDSTVSDETYEGVAPDADILAMRVLDSEGSGSTADIASAVRTSEQNGADVIAMSLGSQVYTAEVAAAISDACAGNTTTVTVATGNSRRNGAPFLASPSDVPNDCVVSVAASNTSAPETAGVASFSQLGPDVGADLSNGATTGQEVDVAAPGMRVTARVATTEGGTRTHTLSGTSMAQPFVAGATLQTLDGRPGLVNDSADAHDALTDTARPMPNAAAAEAGSGMVAADRAVADNTTGQTQAEAMDDAASNRNEFWSGGGVTGFVDRALSAVDDLASSVGL